MFKKLGIFLLMLLMLSNLIGCSGGSHRITIGDVNSSQNDIRGNYDSFSGYYFKKVKIEDGETLKVTFSVITEKGELIAKVIDADGKTLNTLHSGDTVNLTQSGKYKLQVEGKKHKGSFILSWELD